MDIRLGPSFLEQLGQPPTRPNRPRRKPEPTQKEENPLPTAPTNRTAIYVRNLPADQDPEKRLQHDLALSRGHCKKQGLEIVTEYSDPKGRWKAFDQMMAVATGRRPPFGNIVVSTYRANQDAARPLLQSQAARCRPTPPLHTQYLAAPNI